MQAFCDDIRANVPAVLREWEKRVCAEPWYSLPAEHRIDNLPELIVGLVEASLCSPRDLDSHRQKLAAAADHGSHRREHGIPESLIFVEYHLLRQAIWYYLVGRFGPSDALVDVIMRIDTAITLATNASMWGYHRPEIEALGRWDEGMERIARSSPLLV